MECPECHGLGYKEYEHGLIRLHCKSCKGTGVDEPRIDRTSERTNGDYQGVGVRNTGQPSIREKRVYRKRSTK